MGYYLQYVILDIVTPLPVDGAFSRLDVHLFGSR